MSIFITFTRLFITFLLLSLEHGESAAGEKDFQFDTVTVEMERYAYLAPEILKPYIKSDGMLNHFKMMWELRESVTSLRTTLSSSKSLLTSHMRPMLSSTFRVR